MLRLRRRVYLDNNATTPVSPAVRRTMEQVLRRAWGNPSSLYRAARGSAGVLEESRRQVALTVGAGEHEVLFTGCASEANNTVLKSAAELAPPGRRRIVSTPVEHPTVMKTLEYLQGRGMRVELCPVDRHGRAEPAVLERMIDDGTYLVCCMLANNELGTLYDVRAMAAAAHRRGAMMMSDCVQALGKVRVDVKELGVDYAIFSAHKLHGPKGVGALYVREGCPLSPLLHGGHQERGLRAGTESLHAIAGFAAACRGVDGLLDAAPETARLRDLLVEGIRAACPGVRVNTPAEGCLPNTASLTFPAARNALFMAYLDHQGISVSAGSACSTQDDAPSHVLTAVGLSDEEARRTLRISLSAGTSPRDVAYVLRVVRDFLEGRAPPVTALAPGQLDEEMLLDEGLYILDVRFWHDRRILKGLPGSHEAPFFTFARHARRVPRGRRLLVVCQMGYNAPIVAYQLKARHHGEVSFLMGGLVAWRLAHPDLYDRLAGKRIMRLTEEG